VPSQRRIMTNLIDDFVLPRGKEAISSVLLIHHPIVVLKFIMLM
jgi:hypothetical protein